MRGTVRPPRFELPVVPSSFVGREGDTQLIVELLDESRLVTLTGPGGVGKTRLALEVARRVNEQCELGACIVELAQVEDPLPSQTSSWRRSVSSPMADPRPRS